MLLMGAGGALRWTQHDALRARLVAVVEGIAAVAEASGFAVGYRESDTNADMHGNNQLPSYVNSWFTHGMLEAAAVDPRALDVARAFNSYWNNCSFLPQLFPQDTGDAHEGPVPNGYDPAHGYTSSSPFFHGHLLYWMNQVRFARRQPLQHAAARARAPRGAGSRAIADAPGSLARAPALPLPRRPASATAAWP